MTYDTVDDERITSRNWIGDYAKENEVLPAASTNVFSDESSGASQDDVQLPSTDPALRPLPSASRASTYSSVGSFTFDPTRILTLDSLQPGGSFDWLQRLTSETAAGSTTDSKSSTSSLGEEEPPLTPEHEARDEIEEAGKASCTVPVIVTKPLPTSRSKSTTREYVTNVQQWDILSERGGKANHHDGNKRYRKVVSDMKTQYRGTEEKRAKTDLSRFIVAYIHNYGGRFLKKGDDGRYFIMTDAEARKKTSQALRETKQLKWTQVDEQDHVEV